MYTIGSILISSTQADGKTCACGAGGLICRCEGQDISCPAGTNEWIDQDTCTSKCIGDPAYCSSSGDPHYRLVLGTKLLVLLQEAQLCSYLKSYFQIWLRICVLSCVFLLFYFGVSNSNSHVATSYNVKGQLQKPKDRSRPSVIQVVCTIL